MLPKGWLMPSFGLSHVQSTHIETGWVDVSVSLLLLAAAAAGGNSSLSST